MARQEDDIEQAILIILGTAKGERVMRPNFGCGIHELVFAPNNPTTHGLLAYHIEEALTFWEPRIELQEVLVQADPQEPARLLANIRYRIRATNDTRNLVYPFYLLPPGE